jgi:LemA protein
MDMGLIFLLVIGLILFYVIAVYNKLVALREAVRNDAKQIDVQLDRRFKVFESLISTVKEVMDYEKTTLKDVVALRNQAQSARAAGDETKRIAAENQLSQIASGFNFVMEQYPDLKANQNVLKLQDEISNTENKLAFSKQAYNDGIERFNAYKLTFPNNVVCSFFAQSFPDFVYWQLSEDDAKSKDEYTVKF